MPRRVNTQGPLRAVLTQCQDALEHDLPEKTHRSHKIRQYFKFLTTVGIMHETQKVIQWKEVLRSLYTTLFQCYTDNTLNSMEVDLVVPISIIAVGAASLEPYFGSSEAALTPTICRKISQSHRRASRRRSDIMHRALECWHGWASLPVVLPRGRNPDY